MKVRVFRYGWNLFFNRAPIMAQLIVTRRCNLSCGYCSEYDNFSPSIALEELKNRIDHLHRLKTISISLLGGEPLLHPQLSEIVAYAARRSIVSITTNASLLTETLIQDLNRAGLSHMQVSIDSFKPTKDNYIQKNFSGLQKRLLLLKKWAKFKVQVNSVLCPHIEPHFDKLVDGVKAFGFSFSLGLLHDEHGQIQVQGKNYQAMWQSAIKKAKSFFPWFDEEYGNQLLSGEKPDWHCRAGGRYLYIDEQGLVQFCSAKRGSLAKNLSQYSPADLKYYGNMKKNCEKGCAINCVYRTSYLDNYPKKTLQLVFGFLLRK